MMTKRAFLFAIVLLLLPVQANASYSTKPSISYEREEVLEFLEEAFNAQVSLSEQPRTLAEIEAILAPYFSKEYMDLFLEENLVEEDGKYITLGSDFALYFIPFFQFSDDTKIVNYQEKIYVYEYFPRSFDGPVGYESHYEGILIEPFEDGIKVTDYLFDSIPQEVINLGSETRLIQENLNEEKEIFEFPKFLFNRFIKPNPIDLFLFRFV